MLPDRSIFEHRWIVVYSWILFNHSDMKSNDVNDGDGCAKAEEKKSNHLSKSR